MLWCALMASNNFCNYNVVVNLFFKYWPYFDMFKKQTDRQADSSIDRQTGKQINRQNHCTLGDDDIYIVMILLRSSSCDSFV